VADDETNRRCGKLNYYGKFNDFEKDIVIRIENNIRQNQELTFLRDFLLPLLINGQVGFKE